MTLDLLPRAKRKRAEAAVDGDRYLALTAKALEDLLKVTEATSSDYNTVKALVQGEIDTFMGFRFIRTERLPDGGGTGRKYCLAYTSKAIGLCFSDVRFTRVGEDPANSFMTRVYMESTLGAVRIEDLGVVRIEILNT